MAKGRSTTVTDMQMRILNGFDRVLREGERTGEATRRGFTPTSGLLRNAPVGQWKSTPGLKRLSGVDRRIAALRAQLGE